MKAVFFAFALLAAALAAPITLTGTIRDFTPAHPDFEHYLGDELGIVKNNLDVDGKPVLNGASKATVTSAASFAQWYRNTEDVNVAISRSIQLEDLGNGVYAYESNSFFPIDGAGYGNYGNSGHNYHFTSEWRNTFTYVGGETFTFKGDDDVWVFANGYLILDLGGVHGSMEKSVALNTVAAAAGMTIGQDYELAVFQAERHTTGSNFRIETTITLQSETPDAPEEPGRDAWICEVNFPDFCPGEPIPSGTYRQTVCPEDPTIDMGGVTYALDNFNSISFGDFYAPSGDVEGRSLIAGNLNLPNGGYSFGYELRTGGVAAWDRSLPAALVVGKNAVFQSGAVLPDGSNFPYPGDKEGMWIGGTFTGPSYLLDRKVGGSAGALAADLTNAQNYYKLLSESWAAAPVNAVATEQWTTLTIDCGSTSKTSINVQVPATTFNQVTSYNLVSCNAEAQIVITITGTENVVFRGANIEHRAQRVLYNIPGVRDVRIEVGVFGSILAPLANYVQPGMGVVIGIVIAANMQQVHQINHLECVRPAPPPQEPGSCPAFEGECDGLDFPLANGVYSFRDFNVISFNDFVADSSDIEGRLAAKRDVTLGTGYSVGDKLSTANSNPDNSLPYSLVAGRDVAWGSGSLHPDGTANPFPGAKENMFVGRTYSGFQPLADRVAGPCATPGCLDGYFNAAKSCYVDFQNSLSAQADNVAKNVYWSGLFLTCNDVSAEAYTISLLPADFSDTTYVVLDNCNLAASWTLNVRGTGDVTISGGSFPAIPGGVVYNILGTRNVNVAATDVNGHILAPTSTLHQTGGVINGKVVVGDVSASWQINRENSCPTETSVTVEVPTNEPTYIGSNDFVVQSNSFIRTGDSINVGSESFTVTKSTANKISVTPAAKVAHNAGSIIKATISRNSGRAPMDADESSASTVSVTIALLVAFLALLF